MLKISPCLHNKYVILKCNALPQCALSAMFATATDVTKSLRQDEHPLLNADNRKKCIERLRNMPAFRRPAAMSEGKRKNVYASVLIPLCNVRGSNEISLLYTRRSGKLSRHSHQVSFPGGLRDDTDLSYIDCALRETEEEIGLPRARVQIWDESSLIILPRSAAIMPVVGFIPDLDINELQLNTDEVESAFTVPLKRLTMPAVARHTQFKTGYSGPVFVVDNYRIWGITGYLTHIFLRCLLPPGDCTILKNNIKYVIPYKQKKLKPTQ